VEPAEAIARVEEWLRAVHGPGMSEPGGVAMKVDGGGVLRVPEGWLIPYNTAGYLDEGLAEKQIFPPPSLIVREPEGDLRQAHPHPGGLSIPVSHPGRDTWREVVDPEYTAAGLGHLGVPLPAVIGWERITSDGTKTGEERQNPEYTPGPVRRGYPLPGNRLEYLLQFFSIGWLSRERTLIGFCGCEVYAPLDLATGKTPRQYWQADRDELRVFTSTLYLPPAVHGFWQVDPATLAEFKQALNLAVSGPGFYLEITGEEIAATLARFPRYEPKVDLNGTCPEAEDEVAKFAAAAAKQLGLTEPADRPLDAAEKTRKRGFELTGEECRKTVLGRSWLRAESRKPPQDLVANGLAPGYANDGTVVPRVDTFGKYFEPDLPGYSYGWQRVAGAFVGFAIGEALGIAVDRMSLAEIRQRYGERGVTDYPVAFERPGQIGSLTQRLLFFTEGVIRSPHRENPDAEGQFAEVVSSGLRRWGHTQGVEYPQADGWLVRVPELHARRGPEPGGPDVLLPALPAALTEGGPRSGLTGGVRQAVRLLAGLTHSADLDLDTATYLAWLYQHSLTKEPFALPTWALSRQLLDNPEQQGPAWATIREVVADAVPVLTTKGLPNLRDPERIGDGEDTVSVLGRALAAVSGYENYPEQGLLRAVNHSGRSALTGALAGSLLGARLGIPGLPRKWVDGLELRYLIENVATDAFWHFDRHSALGEMREDWRERYPGW
jgi:ADP-ribosylglycohydrolase